MRRPAYLQLGQEALDREYNNREQRPGGGFEAFVERCKRRSADARSDLTCALDISFGPDLEERLDIFMPDAVLDAPVNIFFHGGYWRASTKEDFSYVAFGGIPAGIMTVVVNYGLIPSVTMAELIAQCQRSVVWIYSNIRKFGGDPSKLYLSGHSAGAHIVSMLMCTKWSDLRQDLPADLIKGACAISGIYDLEPVRRSFLNKTLGFSDADVTGFSSVALTPVVRCPLLCAVGGDESSEFIRQTEEFAERWQAHNLDIDMHVLAGKDHFSIREDLGDPGAPMNVLMIKHLEQALS